MLVTVGQHCCAELCRVLENDYGLLAGKSITLSPLLPPGGRQFAVGMMLGHPTETRGAGGGHEVFPSLQEEAPSDLRIVQRVAYQKRRPKNLEGRQASSQAGRTLFFSQLVQQEPTNRMRLLQAISAIALWVVFLLLLREFGDALRRCLGTKAAALEQHDGAIPRSLAGAGDDEEMCRSLRGQTSTSAGRSNVPGVRGMRRNRLRWLHDMGLEVQRF